MQWSLTRGFSQTAIDQTIEQTLNRSSKGKGGIVGRTLREGYVHRWILTAHERAAITEKCKSLAGQDQSDYKRNKEESESRIIQDEDDVTGVKVVLDR